MQGGVGLVNLFARLESAERPLTPALLAFLEHSDPAILAGLLERAGLEGPPLEEVEFLYPAPDAPPGTGEIRSHRRRLRVAAMAPGDDWHPDFPAGPDTLLINMAGTGPAGVRSLSWEQVDRWLAEAADAHDPQTRTGFLIRQFRSYLPEVGITYFTGFRTEDLKVVSSALEHLSRFYRDAGDLFARLLPSLPEGLEEVRQSRPEDLLAGYCYRDYVGTGLGTGSFLRIALHVGPAELQIACWLGAGTEAHGRIQAVLQDESPLLDSLQEMDPLPIIRLWAPDGEQRVNLSDLNLTWLSELDWGIYTIAIEVAHPFADLAGEGLVTRISRWTTTLLDRLAPVLTGVIH